MRLNADTARLLVEAEQAQRAYLSMQEAADEAREVRDHKVRAALAGGVPRIQLVKALPGVSRGLTYKIEGN